MLAARRDVFERVGRFDERFLFEYEETEWEDRVRAAGFRPALRSGGARAPPLRAQRHREIPRPSGAAKLSRRLYRERRYGRLRRALLERAAARPPRPVRATPLGEPFVAARAGASLAVSTNPSLIPFAGASLDADFRLPEDVLASLPAGSRVPARLPFVGRAAPRDLRLGEAVSGFEIRDAAASDAPGHPATLRTRLQERSSPKRNGPGSSSATRTAGTASSACSTDEIVGNYAGWGMRFLLDGEERLLYSVGDVATDPSVRALGGRRGVYRAMTEAFYDRVGGRVPFCFGFPNARALKVSERIVGSRTLFPIVLKKTPVEAFGPPPPDAEAGEAVDEAFDPLWEAGRRSFTHAAVRDRARVNWRFHARPSRYYRMVWRRQGRELVGWAALSVVGEDATVADLLGREPDGRDLAASLLRRPPTRPGDSAPAASSSGNRPGAPCGPAVEALPGERADAGFPMIVRVFDEGAVRRFAERLHLVPSLYDLT